MFKRNQAAIKPLARIEGLSITESGDETLVYDRDQFVIHRLDADIATVWKLADGQKDISSLAAETGLAMRTVEDAVQSLAAMGLVQGDVVQKSRLSRRLFVGGAAGAAAAGTLIAPVAASACVNGDRNTSPCNGGHFLLCENGVWSSCCRNKNHPTQCV